MSRVGCVMHVCGQRGVQLSIACTHVTSPRDALSPRHSGRTIEKQLERLSRSKGTSMEMRTALLEAEDDRSRHKA